MNIRTISIIALLLTGLYINAQEQTENKAKLKVELLVNGGIGYAVIENDVEPNYNLNANTFELLYNFKIWNNIGVATGARYSKLTGNGYNSIGNFYQTKSLVQIPLLLSLTKEISPKMNFQVFIGPYAQTSTEDSFKYLNATDKNVYNKWSFGLDMGIGIIYKVDSNLNVGFYFNSQSDFNKTASDNTALIQDTQKIKNISTVGIMASFTI